VVFRKWLQICSSSGRIFIASPILTLSSQSRFKPPYMLCYFACIILWIEWIIAYDSHTRPCLFAWKLSILPLKLDIAVSFFELCMINVFKIFSSQNHFRRRLTCLQQWRESQMADTTQWIPLGKIQVIFLDNCFLHLLIYYNQSILKLHFDLSFYRFWNSKTCQGQLPMISSIDSLIPKFTPLTFISFYVSFVYIYTFWLLALREFKPHFSLSFFDWAATRNRKGIAIYLDCFFFWKGILYFFTM
jgi:hypothetical protein